MVGFKVLTAEGGAKVAANAVVVTYEGPIAYPMAENLRAIWDEVSKRPGLEKVILRLNSPGGSDVHGLEVIGILKEIRERVRAGQPGWRARPLRFDVYRDLHPG